MSQIIDRPSLKDVAHSQCDALHDAELLLSLAVSRLPSTGSPDDDSNLARLINMARDTIHRVGVAFDPYI